MPNHDDKLILVVRQTFSASAEFLFDAWTNPEWMAKWFHAGADWTTQVLQSDLRAGGAWEIEMRPSDGPICRAFGKYVAIERPRRLVFTWIANEKGDAPYETTVSLTFKPIDRHTTELVLTQTGLRTEKDHSEHQHGWHACLANLERLCNERRS
jgi:uncharacterized protein YndB with AHSA1/START domain